ncbi:Methyltransferase type 11 [Hyella patelloides LEGE 07179]|uniref:Methyltransferase type 11 n=1 Tax=Hyella patelloides LEGE 07179 TaxID=945734 RepID=A0A563VMJ9_9CYAN|nr:class I SAM-dependent methyltransferase [Hyella patelloides]VEP12684.1 Methyltransferase type 11 [Hyella patelloides LEGE 07179]
MNPKIKIAKNEKRTIEQIREHYEIEKELATQLRNSTHQERQYLYTALYDELFRKVPLHPQLALKSSSKKAIAWIVAQRMQLLKSFLSSDTTYLEVGPGDCGLSMEVAKKVKQVYAIDVSNEIVKNIDFPSNFQFVISDGCSIPIAENSIDVAYSHQLMEHLHPDDALTQLKNIYKAIKPGGVYICITPNRLSGPHDISKYFDEVATGFHLKEYTVSELYQVFRTVGFSQVNLYKSRDRYNLKIPLNTVTIPMLRAGEKVIGQLPYSLRRKIASQLLLFRGITIVGKK